MPTPSAGPHAAHVATAQLAPANPPATALAQYPRAQRLAAPAQPPALCAQPCMPNAYAPRPAPPLAAPASSVLAAARPPAANPTYTSVAQLRRASRSVTSRPAPPLVAEHRRLAVRPCHFNEQQPRSWFGPVRRDEDQRIAL
ncbi:hypothetical protein J5N97_028515 [Dioscorea zingiberensis]|uniref:Uncharacterized protein n=1 Tax=Dioscorea zingiberensis TaxID=325984 RepID=A0A9D5H4W4_9LILI|nr:hypothetical protein J5N97_028515 [Dioscorea zingiberensis]